MNDKKLQVPVRIYNICSQDVVFICYRMIIDLKQLVSHSVSVTTNNTHTALHRHSFEVHKAVGLA